MFLWVQASNSGGVLKFKIDGKDVPALVLMHGDEWRTVRHSLTPAFSSLKMKLVGNASIPCHLA